MEDFQRMESAECKPGYLSSIKLLPGQAYKNLTDSFEWKNIPMFAVITGRNGVGKSALLEAIRESINERLMDDEEFKKNAAKRNSASSNENEAADKKRFETHLSRGGVPQLLLKSEYIVDDLLQNGEYNETLGNEANEFAKYCLTKSLLSNETPIFTLKDESLRVKYDEALQTFVAPKQWNSSNLNILAYNNMLTEELKFHWIRHSKKSHLSRFGLSVNIVNRLYNSDGDELNKFLTASGFKYHIALSDSLKPLSLTPTLKPTAAYINYQQQQLPYNVLIKPKRTDDANEQQVAVTLSFGEEVQLLMLLWQYEELADRAKVGMSGIMLLDEPDAHLHTDLVSNLIGVYKDIFVNKHDVQVIITTHNPTTVSLVHQENLFIMTEKNGQPIIRPAKNKQETVRSVLPAHIGVYDRIRSVFVDSDNDSIFFDATYTLFKRMTNPLIGYRLLFMPPACQCLASGQVEHFVNRMTHEEKSQCFSDCVFGITSNAKTMSRKGNKTICSQDSNITNVFNLQRNSVNNYVYDPVHLYFVFEHLAEQRKLKHRKKWLLLNEQIKKKHPHPHLQSILCDQQIHRKALQMIVNKMTLLFKKTIKKLQLIKRKKDKAMYLSYKENCLMIKSMLNFLIPQISALL